MLPGLGPAPPPSGRLPTGYPRVSQLAPIGALPTAPGRARAHVRATLDQWGQSALAAVAELLISEMVTNAVKASANDDGQPAYLAGRLPGKCGWAELRSPPLPQ